jgi:hypothetical protein
MKLSSAAQELAGIDRPKMPGPAKSSSVIRSTRQGPGRILAVFRIAGFGVNRLWPGAESAGFRFEDFTGSILILLVIIVASVVSLIGRVMRRVALIVPQLSIDTIGGEQLGMRAALDRLAA